LQELISDAYRFSQAFSDIIGYHPLQVYAGALPFTPIDTLLYRTFHDNSQYPWIVTLKSREKSWPSLLATFREIRTCHCIRFSPDSMQVMASGRFGVFLIHDVTRATVYPPIRRGLSRSCAFSPDGTWACSIHEDGYMRMWDPILESSIMEPIPIPRGGRQEATFLVASPHGTLIAYSCGRTIYVWRVRSGTKIFESTPRTTQTNITCLTFSPNSNLVVSGSENGDISSWDLTSGDEVLGQSGNHTARVLSVHVTVDDSQILSVGKDWFVRVWDTALGTCILVTSLQERNGVAQLAAFSADGQQIVLSTNDGTIGLWSSSSGMQIRIITTNLPDIIDVALSPNGRIVASANGQSVSLWDATIAANTTVNLSHRQWHAPWITNPWITYSSDGTLLAFAATEDEQPNPIILILDGNSGKEMCEPLRGHEGSDIGCIVFSPDTSRIASSSNDGICVWDTTGARVSAITEAQASSVQTLAFSPDGWRLVSGSRHGGAIYVWEAGSGIAILGPFHSCGCCPDSESIDSVSFSPDGGRIVSASGHGIVHIWDAESGAMILGPFRGCSNNRLVWPRVAFSIDGTRIIIHTRHDDFKQWDAIEGAEIATWPTNILACGAIDRFTFCRPTGWIIDLTTGFHLSYPPVPLIFGMRSSSSQTSVAFATSTNIYIIHFPPRMLSQ
jgi:WD40 repeat protein